MNGWSIKTKITLWFIAILLFVLAANFVVFFSIGERVARSASKETLMDKVDDNIGEVHYLSDEETKESGIKSDRIVVAYPDGNLVVDDFHDTMSGVATGIYSSEGQLLYGKNPIRDAKGVDGFKKGEIRSVETDDKTFYIYDKPVEVEGHEKVWVRGMIDRAHGRSHVYRMYKAYVHFVPLMMMVAALMAYAVVSRAMAPLGRIAGETALISKSSDLSHRLHVVSKDREISNFVFALNSMLFRLENSYSTNKKFTSNISHDLRTPVAIIQAQTELALDEELPDETREAFETIQRQVKRMNDILDALITYNRLENVNGIYEVQEAAISDVVKNTCKSFRVMQGDDLILDESIQEGIVIKGNEALLNRLLENLLQNAFKYGGDSGKIWVKLEADNEKVRLSVSDKGPGIPEEEQENIFDWMYQGELGKQIGGSGFGLFIVKTIVEFHDGEILLDSTPGEGTTFTIVFDRLR